MTLVQGLVETEDGDRRQCGIVLMGNPNPEMVMAGMIKKKAVTIACCYQ